MEQREKELPGITESVDGNDAVAAAQAGAIIAMLGATILRYVDENRKPVQKSLEGGERRFGSVGANIGERLLPKLPLDWAGASLVQECGDLGHRIEASRYFSRR